MHQLHTELVHFNDLQSLIEAFIAEERQIDSIKQSIQTTPEPLINAIRQSFPDLLFYPTEDYLGEVSDVKVVSAKVSGIRVIDIHNHEFTIAFRADVKFSSYVSYDDAGTAIIDSSEDVFIPLRRKAGTVTEETAVMGTVALELSADWCTIVKVSEIDFETNDIEVETEPQGYEYDEDDSEEPQP